MSDWSPLASENPVPGSPEGIAQLARQLSATASSIRLQAKRLRGIECADFWEGEAADRFLSHQEKLPPILDDLGLRYERVSAALNAYHPRLAEAQATARKALMRAREAEQAIRTANDGVDDIEEHYRRERHRIDQLDPADYEGHLEPEPWSGPNWELELQDAESRLDSARQLLKLAIMRRDEAATVCAVAIEDAIDDDLKNKTGLFDSIKSLVSLETLSRILEVVAVALAVVAIAVLIVGAAPVALGFLAPLVAALPAVLTSGGVALAVGGSKLAVDFARYRRGDITKGQFKESIFGFALSGLSFGAGRLAKTPIKIIFRGPRWRYVAEGEAGDLFPSLKTIDRTTTLLSELHTLEGSEDWANFQSAIAEYADERYVEPITGLFGRPSGIHTTSQEKVEEQDAALTPGQPAEP